MKNKMFEIRVQLMINESLYKKTIIDEETYIIVKEKLIKELNNN